MSLRFVASQLSLLFVVLGATLVILNRPTVVEDDPNQGVRVAPVAAPNYLGAVLETTW